MSPAKLRLVGSTPDDAVLIDAIERGDRTASVAIYDRLRPVISRTVRRVAPRGLEHDDLVQQAFVELIVSLRSRPEVRSLDAWASTITARVVFHRLRRDHLENRFAMIDDEGGVIDRLVAPQLDPHHATAQREALSGVARCMAKLNADRMQVFVLHDVHGFELKEIAEILGISVSNAQTRLVRGRKELHQSLEAHPELRATLHREGEP
ncbi:MAG: RNA polymerase sigma factor [Archangium sp.]